MITTMNKAAMRSILFVVFVDLTGFGLIIPLIPEYARRLDATGLTLGLLIGAYSVMQLIFTPLLGRWSDHVGRRKVLLASVGGSVFSHALLGVGDLAHSLPLLFAARMLDGITGANVATAQAYIADVTTGADRARGMGLFGAAFGMGFVVGPAMGAGLASLGTAIMGSEYGTCWPAFGASAIALVAFILIWRLLSESRPVAEGTKRMPVLRWDTIRTVWHNPRLRELFLLLPGFIFAFVLLEVSFVWFLKDRFGATMATTSLVFAYVGVLIAIVQGGLVGRLSKRFGEIRLLTVGPFITATGFLLVATVSLTVSSLWGWLLMLGACIPVALGSGISNPNLMALLSRHGGRARQGGTLGLSQGVASLARAVSPPVGGLLYDIGAPVPFIAGAVLFLIIGAGVISILPAQRKAIATLAEEENSQHDASASEESGPRDPVDGAA